MMTQWLGPIRPVYSKAAEDRINRLDLPVVGLPPLVTAHALGMTRLLQVLLLFAEDAVLEEEPEVQQREEATQKTRARRLPVHVY